MTASDFIWLTTPEVARLLGVSEATIFRMLQRAEAPPSYRIGRRRLWRECDLLDWLESACREEAGAGR